MSHLPDVDTLGNVVGSVFEESAFVFTEPCAQPAEPLREGWVAEVCFASPVQGCFRLSVSTELAVALCAGLLGQEPDDPGVNEGGSDAIGEVANMVVGALLPAWLGDSVEYELGTPKVRPLLDEKAPCGVIGDTTLAWRVTEEGQYLLAEVRMGAPP
jgi:hypothetical protein